MELLIFFFNFTVFFWPAIKVNAFNSKRLFTATASLLQRYASLSVFVCIYLVTGYCFVLFCRPQRFSRSSEHMLTLTLNAESRGYYQQNICQPSVQLSRCAIECCHIGE